MNYDQFAVDSGKQLIDALNSSVDFSALQKSLAGTWNFQVPDLKVFMPDDLQLKLSNVFSEIGGSILSVNDLPQLTASLNTITEYLNSPFYQSMTSQWVDTLRKSIQALPIEDFEARQEIPVEEVQEVFSDIKSCLPEEVAGLLDAKVEEVQTTNKKISASDWIAIIGIIVTILLSIFEQLSSAEHDQKEEAAWSALAEYRQESIELQKQDIALKQEILECLKNQNDIAAEAQETSVNALETAHEGIQTAVDISDLPNDPQEKDTLNEIGCTQN